MRLKKIQIIIFCVLLAVLFGLHFPRVIHLRNQLKSLTEKETSIKNAYNIDQNNKKFIEDIQGSIDEKMAVLNRKIPGSGEKIQYYKFLSDIAKKTGVSKITFRELSEKDKKRFSRGVQKQANANVMPVIMEIQAGYINFGAFMRNLLNSDRLLVIKSIAVEIDRVVSPDLRISINANAFFMPDTKTGDSEK